MDLDDLGVSCRVVRALKGCSAFFRIVGSWVLVISFSVPCPLCQSFASCGDCHLDLVAWPFSACCVAFCDCEFANKRHSLERTMSMIAIRMSIYFLACDLEYQKSTNGEVHVVVESAEAS